MTPSGTHASGQRHPGSGPDDPGGVPPVPPAPGGATPPSWPDGDQPPSPPDREAGGPASGPTPPPPPTPGDDGKSGCRGRTVLVVLGVLGVVGLVVVGVVVWLLMRVEPIEIPEDVGASPPGSHEPPGADADLDRLWTSCGDGDMQACDDLYFESDVGSDYEAFGATCGYRIETNDLCVDAMPDGG